MASAMCDQAFMLAIFSMWKLLISRLIGVCGKVMPVLLRMVSNQTLFSMVILGMRDQWPPWQETMAAPFLAMLAM